MKFDLDQIKELLDAFEERKMQKLELKHGEFEILLERSVSPSDVVASPYMPSMPVAQIPQAPIHADPSAVVSTPNSAPVEPAGTFITSPMVGTFYAAPAPEEPPFVKVGDTVKEGQVVCIVEAMKVMNEVKATESGVVKEILMENGHPVEFGSKIFRLG